MSFKSNFQRTQSKVWWANVPERDDYGFASLPEISAAKARSRKSLTPPEISTTSWSYQRGSPGSLKSQDSGFSDSDHSHNQSSSSIHNNSSNSSDESSNNHNLSPTNGSNKLTPNKNINHQINLHLTQRSPSISSDQSTPPTVIRKKINIDHTQAVGRRISFSAPSSPVYERIDSPCLLEQINSINFSSTSPNSSNSSIGIDKTPISQNDIEANNCKCTKDRSIKRGKVITRSSLRTNRKLLSCVSQLSIGSTTDVYHLSTVHAEQSGSALNANDMEAPIMMQKAIPQTPPKSILKSPKLYNNETVIFGTGDAKYIADSNNNNISQDEQKKHLPTYTELYPPKSTSTPNKDMAKNNLDATENHNFTYADFLDLTATMNWQTCTYINYTNPLLNNHASSVQFWLDELRSTYCHEVLSTLQTKSISQNAIKNSELNSAIAGKIIRQLQSKAMMLQKDFEKIEDMLNLDDDSELCEKVPYFVMRLHESIFEFIQKLGYKKIFRMEKNAALKTFKSNVASIMDMSRDLKRAVATRLDELENSVLLEDVHILKRYLMITIQMVFEQLVKIIVDRVEVVECDLILRSNLSLLAMLSNMDYTGFASLNEAFIANEAVQVLLVQCVESKSSSIRTLSLRALATICSTKQTIRQFEQAGGTEVIKDILTETGGSVKRSDLELREALSVFTQITAPWHGSDHHLDGLKDFTECLVEHITNIGITTTCCQTLLLAFAALNNLSRMEKTSIYSLMSNETILKFKAATMARGPGASIFLYVSIVFYFQIMAFV